MIVSAPDLDCFGILKPPDLLCDTGLLVLLPPLKNPLEPDGTNPPKVNVDAAAGAADPKTGTAEAAPKSALPCAGVSTPCQVPGCRPAVTFEASV